MAKKVRVVAREVYYGGRTYKQGDVITTYADTEAEAMVMVGSAAYETAAMKPDEPAAQPRAETADDAAKVSSAEAAASGTSPQRRYSRKDLRAVD